MKFKNCCKKVIYPCMSEEGDFMSSYIYLREKGWVFQNDSRLKATQ